MALELWLVRHAKAGRRGPEWPDDRLRPLTPAGERQAARLAELMRVMEVGADRLFSSPWLRAAQTAEPLRAVLRPGRTVEYLDALAAADPNGLLGALRERLQAGDRRAVCVGHEPHLGRTASLLSTARPDGLAIAFAKCAALVLEGDLSPGGMALLAFFPPRLTRAAVSEGS